MSDWSAFEDRLATTLSVAADRVFLIISLAADSSRYVQFAADGARLDAEAASAAYAVGADTAALERSGWTAPVGASANWPSPLVLPALMDEYRALASRCVVALRDAYGASAPEDLVYRAWREPESTAGKAEWTDEELAALDRGEDPLNLTTLGLPSQVGDAEPERSQIPGALAEARELLSARPLGLVPFQIRGQALALRGAEAELEAAVPIVADYYLGAVLDLRGGTVPVSASMLEAWGIDLPTALEAAHQRQEHADGEADGDDGAVVLRGVPAAAELLRNPAIAEAHASDVPVVVVPDAGTVVIGSADDESSLIALALAAERVLAESEHPVSITPLVAVDGRWEPFEWPASAEAAVRRLQRRWDALQYAAARPALQELYRRSGQDVFVSECVLADDPSGRTVTYAALLNGRTVTPRVDLLVLNDGSGGIRPVPFDEVAALDGVLAPAPGAVPEHYLVTRFPAELL